MKINKLTATFGKFNNESITFHGGLNVIYAPNESGKTTWCAFIMAMLYGVDGSERQRAGTLPVRQKYAPWSGAPMEGTAELTADRCDLTVMRTTRIKNAPMQEFTAVYTGTAIPVEGMTGENAGEMLTGVSREVFARSAFVGQGGTALTNSPEMEKRIQTILSTGEEEASFSEVDERLAAWQRKRSYHQKGFLPELEKQIGWLDETIEAADEAAKTIEEAEEQLKEYEKTCEELEAALTQERKEHRKQIFQELRKAREEAKILSEEQNEALEELSERRNDLRRSLFGRRSAEEVEKEAERDLARLEQLEAAQRFCFWWIPALVCFLLAVAGAAIYERVLDAVAVIAAAAIFCVAALVFFVLYIRQRTASGEAKKQATHILRKYRAAGPEEITDRLDEHHAYCVAAKKAAERAKKCTEAADASYEKLMELEKQATDDLDLVSGDSQEARLGRALAEARKHSAELSSRLSTEKGKLAVIGDPLVMRSERSRLEEEHRRISEEMDAIGMARDVLKEADTEIQSRFTPELGQIAAEYMSFVTGGRYEGIMLNRDFSALAKTKDDAVARKSEYLSAGTVDLLYLAVRLAVCELALPTGEPCPLILDDVLINMDDTRVQQAMKLLGEIAKRRQVIFFTCRDKVETNERNRTEEQ